MMMAIVVVITMTIILVIEQPVQGVEARHSHTLVLVR
eukprot:COSAG01_NODE_58689_length_304_cov_1.253659_1_plen_36_part_01